MIGFVGDIIDSIKLRRRRKEYCILKNGYRDEQIRYKLLWHYGFDPFVVETLIKSGDWQKVFTEAEIKEVV